MTRNRRRDKVFLKTVRIGLLCLTADTTLGLGSSRLRMVIDRQEPELSANATAATHVTAP